MARKCPSRGDNQLYGVSDDNGVVGHVAILWAFQHRPLDKFAIAVTISRVGILPCTADLDRTLNAGAAATSQFDCIQHACNHKAGKLSKCCGEMSRETTHASHSQCLRLQVRISTKYLCIDTTTNNILFLM